MSDRRTTAYPAITIWQPWATLIAEGCKPFEFRGHPAPVAYRGKRIALHAGARKVRLDEVKALLVKLESPHWRETGLRRDEALVVLERIRQNPAGLITRAIVCLATLGVPVRNAELAERLGTVWVNDSERHEQSNWGWPLSDIERLEPPQPAVGMQGWWNWTAPECREPNRDRGDDRGPHGDLRHD